MQERPVDRKTQIAEVFGRAAPTYDRSGRFAHFGRRLVAGARLAPGARVLDVATGRGAVLFAAAEQVGPEGHVIGIDLSGPMVQATAAEIQSRGVAQAEVHCMDADQLAFDPASFDAVLCGFGIRFFANLDHGLSEFRRVLRPGGVVVVSDWGQRDPRWDRLQELRRTYGVEDGLGITRFKQPAEVESALRRAGLEGVEVSTDEAEFVFGSEAEWWDDLWSSGTRVSMERLDPDRRARFQQEAFERLRELRVPQGFPERRQAIIGRGMNPEASPPRIV